MSEQALKNLSFSGGRFATASFVNRRFSDTTVVIVSVAILPLQCSIPELSLCFGGPTHESWTALLLQSVLRIHSQRHGSYDDIYIEVTAHKMWKGCSTCYERLI